MASAKLAPVAAAALLIMFAVASVEADGIMGWNCGGSIMVAHLQTHATGGMMIRGYGPMITMQRIPLVRVVVRRFSLPQSDSSPLDQLDMTTRDDTDNVMRGEADVGSSKSDSQHQQQQGQEQEQEQGYDAEDFAQHVDSLFGISHPLALFRDNLAELSRLHAMRTRALEMLRERMEEQAASVAAAAGEEEQQQQVQQMESAEAADPSAVGSAGDASSLESAVESSTESSADFEDGAARGALRYAAETTPADRMTRGLEDVNENGPSFLSGTREPSAEPSVLERREELLETVGLDDDDQAAVIDGAAVPAWVKAEDDDVASSSFLDRLAYTMTGNTAAEMDGPTLVLSLVLLGLAFALLVAMMVLSLASIIYGCNGEERSEEPRVVVVDGDDAKTPLLQTYEVHYGTKASGDPMPTSGAVSNPIGKYEPPVASFKA